ncbi:MAG: phage virion morphogenesis protein [Desulfobulbus sp.]
MQFGIEIEDHEVNHALKGLEHRVIDLHLAMAAIGLYYERSVLENFQNESAPDGTPWAKLSATTLQLGLGRNKGFGKKGGLTARGKRYLQGKRILRESGDLEAAVHSQAGLASVTIGVGGHIPYAAIHQFGGQAGRGRKVTIPARPYLGLNAGEGMTLAGKDKQRVQEIVEQFVLGQ